MKKWFFIGLLFLAPYVICGTVVFAALNIGDLMTIAGNSRFQNRCAYYLDAAAFNVMSEDPATAGHAKRVQYAYGIINGGINLQLLAADVLTNTTIASEAALGSSDFSIPDSDIQFTINSLFNGLAGVSS